MPSTLFMLAALVLSASPPDAKEPTPLLWGVDDAGGPAALHTLPWSGALFEEFGWNLYVHHAVDQVVIADNVKWYKSLDTWCEANGVQWIYNIEGPNWIASFKDELGRDWYNQPDGRHFGLYPPELRKALGESTRLVGLMYDEPAHMQNCRNMILNNNVPFASWMYAPGKEPLTEAAECFTKAVKETADLYAKDGVQLYTEHVFPALFHSFARAGWTPGTKILKENWCPVAIATLMGAALQYDKTLWITPDLWGVKGYPGHSVDEYTSALLLGYHMGADSLYTENLAYDDGGKGIGSLILIKGDTYQVTPYGEAAKRFIHEYVPAHPRHYRFQDLKPRVVIIRQDDSCWGQRGTWLGDTLFGNPNWQSTDQTEALFKIWHLLTLGAVPIEAINWNAGGPYVNLPYQVLCPMDGVVVYDDWVDAARLGEPECIFLTGLGIREPALRAVEARVQAGAVCIALPHLLPERVKAVTGDNGEFADGKGKWLAATDFLVEPVREAIKPVLPEPGVIHYRFGDTDVYFRAKGGDLNRIEVEVKPVN